ncbi:hypothetical protein Q7C36_011162, partial [Tachysurus vachellii]
EAGLGLDKEAMMKGAIKDSVPLTKVLPEASSLVSLTPRSSVVPPDLSFSPIADTSVGDVSFKVTPAQHADMDRTRAPRFPVKHPRSTRKIQEWHLKVYKPVIFVGDSNLARIPQFYNPSVQVDSFPGANFLHISKVLQKLTPNPNTQKVILALGINNKDQLFRQTSKKQLQELWRSAATAFPNATVYTPVIHFSDLLPASQQENLRKLNEFIYSQEQLLSKGLTFVPTPRRVVPGKGHSYGEEICPLICQHLHGTMGGGGVGCLAR